MSNLFNTKILFFILLFLGFNLFSANVLIRNTTLIDEFHAELNQERVIEYLKITPMHNGELRNDYAFLIRPPHGYTFSLKKSELSGAKYINDITISRTNIGGYTVYITGTHIKLSRITINLDEIVNAQSITLAMSNFCSTKNMAIILSLAVMGVASYKIVEAKHKKRKE